MIYKNITPIWQVKHVCFHHRLGTYVKFKCPANHLLILKLYNELASCTHGVLAVTAEFITIMYSCQVKLYTPCDFLCQYYKQTNNTPCI